MVVWSSQCHNIFWLHQQRWIWENHGEQSPGGRGQHKVPVYWQRTNGDVCCHCHRKIQVCSHSNRKIQVCCHSHRKIQVCCHSNRNIQICCHSHRYVLFVIDKYKYVSWSQKNTGNGQTYLETWKQRSWYENMQLFIDKNKLTWLAWFLQQIYEGANWKMAQIIHEKQKKSASCTTMSTWLQIRPWFSDKQKNLWKLRVTLQGCHTSIFHYFD